MNNINDDKHIEVLTKVLNLLKSLQNHKDKKVVNTLNELSKLIENNVEIVVNILLELKKYDQEDGFD